MNLLNLLSIEDKNKLSRETFLKGDTLFMENDFCQKLGFVLSGEVKISTFSASGKEIVFNVVKKDEMFGNNLMFSSSPYYKGYVIASEDSEVAFINKSELTKILMGNEKFLTAFLAIQSNFSKNERLTIELLRITSASERLLFFLKENNNNYTYSSITSLAVELNLERETLSRTITRLVKNNIIRKEGKTLILID